MIKPLGPMAMPQYRAPAPMAPQKGGPGIGQQLAQATAKKLAAEQAAKLGLGAAGTAMAGPVGGAIGSAAGDLAGPLAGQLIGGLFNKGGPVYKEHGGSANRSIWDTIKDQFTNRAATLQGKKPEYKEMGGMTKGPLGMSDLLAAGKGKDVSKVSLKKKGKDIEDHVEIAYHAPLAAKPKGE